MNKAQGDGARNGCKGGRNPAPVRMQENRHGLETHFSTPLGHPKLSFVGECLQTDWCCREVHHPGYGNPARLDDQSRNCPQVWIPCLLYQIAFNACTKGLGHHVAYHQRGERSEERRNEDDHFPGVASTLVVTNVVWSKCQLARAYPAHTVNLISIR